MKQLALETGFESVNPSVLASKASVNSSDLMSEIRVECKGPGEEGGMNPRNPRGG